MKTYRAGIDIGSTTVKLVVLDENDNIIYGDYRRHQAHTQQTLAALLREACEALGDCALTPAITGSGSINLGRALDIPFVQEVVAVASALEQRYPQTDVAIELGGEDAKIIYFTGGLEERMNGVCAGGTGSFIDQMAALLQTDAKGLNDAAADYRELYTIAARCGVFAKTDIQPLINEARWGRRLYARGGQPDHQRTGLRQAHPGLRGLSGRAAALPAGAEKGLYPHVEADNRKHRGSRRLPPVRRHGCGAGDGSERGGAAHRRADRPAGTGRHHGVRDQAAAAAVRRQSGV